MPFERILEELLLQEHYHSNESHMDPIRILRKEILNDSHIIKCIKIKTFEWILKNYKNWQCEAALNNKDSSMFTCFSIALQNYLKIIIKHTIYKVLYSIEKLPEITRIFDNESNEFKMEKVVHIWKQSFIDKIVNIDYLLELRLSIFSSDIVNDLEFPFSFYFLINCYRRYYLEELDILTQDSENIKELIEDHIEDFRNSLIFIHPNFDNLQKCSELYYNEFIRIILSTYSIKLASKGKLDFIFRYLIGDKFADDPFILHIYWWKYATEILIQLKLVETFPDLITKAQNDFIVYGKLYQYLFKESINSILQNICDGILFDIKKILPQEPILADKMLVISAMFQQSIILNSSSNSINLFELLLLFEIILCFIKELLVKNNNILILDFVNQWLKLAKYNITSINILEEFSLKHIIAFYELIEEQIANSVIHDIDDKFKIPLTQQLMDSINNIIDYDNSEDQNQQLIPAKAFILALKRFIYRFLLIDSNIENMILYIYFLDFTLNLWTSDINRELIKKLFPTCLLVSHAYNSYVYLHNNEKTTNKRQKKSFASTSSTTRKTLIKKYKKFTD
ncbi:4587_t:CDS:2 [Rhizophagus irregularis]|nr:4587_t:CDS:2 [Rhizophagus irregularis]